MRKRFLKAAHIAAALLLTATFTVSCRKELCFDHYRSVAVAFDWEKVWERDFGMSHSSGWDESYHGFPYYSLNPTVPEGVTMLTYGDGDQPGVSFLPADAQTVNIGEGGDHSLLFYNNDTEYIVLSDMASLPQARATTTTRTRSTLQEIRKLHPEERSINPPDILYASFEERVPEVGIHEERPLAVKMQPLVYTYVVRYEFEHGTEHVALARGALAGMAESVYLRTGATSTESATLLFDCETTSYGAEAKVRSFGVPGFPDPNYGRAENTGTEKRYTLNLEVRLTNGSTKEFNFDVSDQLALQPRGGVIVVKNIRVEDNENLNDSGFDVNVSDWGEYEDIDLPIGDGNGNFTK